MTMRDNIAALMWKTQAIDAGAPESVAERQTFDAFKYEDDRTRNTWLKQADAIIAALPCMGWQPIETAPKGRLILISDGHEVVLSSWGKVSHVPIYGWLDIVAKDAEDLDILEDMNPTHWRLLPTPPRHGANTPTDPT